MGHKAVRFAGDETREFCDLRAEDPKVIPSVAHLAEPRHREVLLALYRDRLDYPSARSKHGVGATELEELHQAALEALLQHGRS
ncbi:MAG: hypothetical protein HKN10_06890 [Myxococcales bacterium]|nr:hypothetical protein [Myxococcales bacterium]